jgi:hypothetical protein
LAAKTQPQSQKLLGRIQATTHDRDFSQEDQKDRRREPDALARLGPATPQQLLQESCG